MLLSGGDNNGIRGLSASLKPKMHFHSIPTLSFQLQLTSLLSFPCHAAAHICPLYALNPILHRLKETHLAQAFTSHFRPREMPYCPWKLLSAAGIRKFRTKRNTSTMNTPLHNSEGVKYNVVTQLSKI